MRRYSLAAGLLATFLPFQASIAQGTMIVPVGGSKPKPVPHAPVDPDDTPEEIAKDAQRDLKDTRFYDKPGATRAQYDADWQRCRLIARGSQTPSGSVPYYYNPAVVSPIAAGIGAGIGGAIANAIIEGQQRRANRRNCLLIKGWRFVELDSQTASRVSAMADEERDTYFNTIVGAQQVEGTITERKTFALAPDPALDTDAPVSGPSSVFLGKKVDPAIPFALAPGEAAIVFTFRRPDEGSAGRSAMIQFARYDHEAQDLIYQPRDWKKKGDKTTYLLAANSRDKKAPLEVHVQRITPGDYVVTGSAVRTNLITTSNCFGAPTFRVSSGDVLYLGDFIPYWNVKLVNGGAYTGVAWAAHIEDARKALATQQPALSQELKPAQWRNGATYACSAITMDRWDLPGVEMVGTPAIVSEGEVAESGSEESVVPITG